MHSNVMEGRSVFVENKPLVSNTQNYIQDSSGILPISSQLAVTEVIDVVSAIHTFLFLCSKVMHGPYSSSQRWHTVFFWFNLVVVVSLLYLRQRLALTVIVITNQK